MGIGSRNRAITTRVFTDPAMLALPLEVRWTAIGLRLHADDEGREVAHPRLLWSSIWPLSEVVTEDELILHLLTLEDVGEIQLYSAGDRTYYRIIDFPKVDRGQPSGHPNPPPLANQSRIDREGTRETFAAGEREGGEEARGVFRGDMPPPFGCPEHPEGSFDPCGPCGTARMRHQAWGVRRRERS